jgi:hypothetical protein
MVYWRGAAGVIALRTGMPPGFYPGAHPRECTDGTAATFDRARADFEKAWRLFLSNRTGADFQTWRDERDWNQAEVCDVGTRRTDADAKI